MTLEELTEYCLSYPSSYEDHPFGEGWTAIRHQGNQKLFALILHNYNGHVSVNLKCEPERSDFLRNAFPEVIPGYHMNKEHWNTVNVEGNLPVEDVQGMIKHSYELTRPKRVKKKSEA